MDCVMDRHIYKCIFQEENFASCFINVIDPFLEISNFEAAETLSHLILVTRRGSKVQQDLSTSLSESMISAGDLLLLMMLDHLYKMYKN